MESQTITVRELSERTQSETLELIDVRTPLEFRTVHAKHARNVPLDRLDPNEIMAARNGDAEQTLYVICKGGTRGAKAQAKFREAGYENVVNVEGGTDAWVTASLPAVRGKKAMSLERQVRIAAGFIVFVGAVAAIVTGNVYFAGIPAFVGAGLMFAGITDSCAMGMLIARMPWNQLSDSAETAVCETAPAK